ncbi:MAG: flavodoxin family protein [Euryarchaeota archaeon]|nr:flavodoxin family protein [Euryarchaeota archaeon]MCD6158265.1 flavodoxin family protein [Euryarchaeota archaeon]
MNILPVKILGISASIRVEGNSEYLLKKALEAAKSVSPELVEVEMYKFSGKIISPCGHCLSCIDHRECILHDDFDEIFEKWLEADAIIYSVPVFHLGLPAHFKAFLDRLGQALFARYQDRPPRSMKVIGIIVQGTDLGGGEELATVQLITHALVMGGIPVSGDPPESYIGAIGWTKRSPLPDAIARMEEQGDFDAITTIKAAESVGKRVAYTALMIKNGGAVLKDLLSRDVAYSWFLEKIKSGQPEK